MTNTDMAPGSSVNMNELKWIIELTLVMVARGMLLDALEKMEALRLNLMKKSKYFCIHSSSAFFVSGDACNAQHVLWTKMQFLEKCTPGEGAGKLSNHYENKNKQNGTQDE